MKYYTRILKYILSIVVMFYTAQTTAATFTYSGDQLMGVNGVEALGDTWDVTFHGDTFDNVDTVYGISQPFFTFAESEALTIALAADMSVLTGGLDPEDVNGCSNFSVICSIVTPYTFTTFDGVDLVPNLRVTGFSVEVSPSRTISGSTATTAIRDMNFEHISYAVWEVSAVPVPAAAWLFGSGLLGLVGVARRKKA